MTTTTVQDVPHVRIRKTGDRWPCACGRDFATLNGRTKHIDHNERAAK